MSNSILCDSMIKYLSCDDYSRFILKIAAFCFSRKCGMISLNCEYIILDSEDISKLLQIN